MLYVQIIWRRITEFSGDLTLNVNKKD
jgi:hypothetical protein